MSNVKESVSEKELDWQIRVMEIRKNPLTATPDEIVKLTDDYFMRLYFGDPVRCCTDFSQKLVGSVENITQK